MAKSIEEIRITDEVAKELATEISGEFKKQVEEVENGKWEVREAKVASQHSGTKGRHLFEFQNGRKLVIRSFIKSVAFGSNIYLVDRTLAKREGYFSSRQKTEEHFERILPPECSKVLIVYNLNPAIKKITKNLLEYAPVNIIDAGKMINLDIIETPEEKERRVVLHKGLSRDGQGKFRAMLFKEYNGTCMITGCDTKESLEAAHIIPVSKKGTDSVENGLLLRADLHLLFDAKLMAIDPETLKVHFSKDAGDHYKKYEQIAINTSIVSRETLAARWQEFNKESE